MLALILHLFINIGVRFALSPQLHVHGVNLKHELASLRSREPLKLISTAAEPKTIALTFDDGPHRGKTEKLLWMLKMLNVRATFFVVGKMVDKNPDIVRAEYALGHEVGNHTYDHLNMSLLSDNQISEEYRACSDAIQRATGVRPQFCRPPGGRFDTEVVKAATDQSMYTVLWTDDPGDFALPDSKTLVDRIDRQLKSGGILLLHDGVDETIRILPSLVTELRSRGYRFVTCCDIVAEQHRKLWAVSSRHINP